MDKYLFRGKRVDNGEWVEGAFCSRDSYDSSFVFPDKRAHCCIIPLSGTDEGNWLRVRPETVGLYIGQNDKNGKEIFEGDILLRDKERVEVIFHDCEFALKFSNQEYIQHGCLSKWMCDTHPTEVIGNIHDTTLSES